MPSSPMLSSSLISAGPRTSASHNPFTKVAASTPRCAPHASRASKRCWTTKLEATPWDVDLSRAIAQAFEGRTELAALRKAEALRVENITSAKAGYKPSVQLFAGYGTKSSQFSSDLTEELHGWEAGAQLQ